MTTIRGELKFLIVENVFEDSDDVLISTSSYPVANTRGKTVDDAMEQMCLQLMVHLHGRRVGQSFYMERAR